MKRRSFLPLSGLALLLGATACSEPQVQQADIDACSLLKDSEIESAMGAHVLPGERHDSGFVAEGESAGAYSSTCLWRVDAASIESPRPAPGEYVILQAMRWPEGKSPEIFIQSFHEAAAEGVINRAPEPLSLGDASIWWGDGVAIARRQTSIGVSVRLHGQTDRRREVAEELAKTIERRM